MGTDEALTTVNINTVEATPIKALKFKRKQLEDEYTPRSRHVDKKVPLNIPVGRRPNVDPPSDDVDAPSEVLQQEESSPGGNSSIQAVTEGIKDVFVIEEDDATFNGMASVGSILSQPDFSASVMRATETESITAHGGPDTENNEDDNEEGPASRQPSDVESDVDHVLGTPGGMARTVSNESHRDPSDDENESTPVRGTTASRRPLSSRSPTRTPRLRDFQMPLTTPRSVVDAALRAQSSMQESVTRRSAGSTSTTTTSSTAGMRDFTEADLLSFQTPAPRRQTEPQSHLRRFTTDTGEEMLLDITPRVYSPKSIPIYTLHDLDAIKSEFDRARGDLELRIQSLHEELASSVSNANHHRALAAQGESLHGEYSKKHVRKVTALKTDWERKTGERLAEKDARMVGLEAEVVALRDILRQEREEKKEVIAMAEAVLALQQG